MPDRWIILGSGPSQRYEDVRRTRGLHTVCAVNNQVFMAPWADVLYAADAPWWKEYGPKIKHFTGRRISVSEASKNYGATEIMPVGGREAPGLGRGCLHRGGNSGYQAINLAYNEGAKEIVLLGFDCAHTFGKRHCHEDHPAHKQMGNADGVDTWLGFYPALAKDLKDEGVRVINCTRITAIKCFEQMTFDEYLSHAS